jgi:DNA-binding NarL/FixJ family response regulator
MTAACRILIADTETIMRAGVRLALEAEGFDVVAEAANGADALSEAIRTRPDLCIVDLLTTDAGAATIRQLHRVLPDVPIVVLTGSDREEDLFASLAAGASGFVPKGIPADRLAATLRGVLSGEAALTRLMTATLIREFRRRQRRRRLAHDGGRQLDDLLTARESEVFELLAADRATSEIANELRIADVTVRRHVSAIVRKIGVQDRSAAIRRARETRQAVT